ncbi:MAG: hypothetical protein WD029_02955, partial [Microthrixaceae bacterium]
TVAEAVSDEQYLQRGLVADATSETAGAFRQSAPTWAGTVAPDGPYQIRDAAVSDTSELLSLIGMDGSQIAQLEHSGAIA